MCLTFYRTKLFLSVTTYLRRGIECLLFIYFCLVIWCSEHAYGFKSTRTCFSFKGKSCLLSISFFLVHVQHSEIPIPKLAETIPGFHPGPFRKRTAQRFDLKCFQINQSLLFKDWNSLFFRKWKKHREEKTRQTQIFCF